MIHLSRRVRLGAAAFALICAAWLASARARTPPPAMPAHSARPRPAAATRMMSGVVRAHDTDEWTLRFTGGHAATVRVEGAGLYCAVQSAAEGLVAEDSARDGRCILRVLPARTARFRVLIRNPGASAAPYRLVLR